LYSQPVATQEFIDMSNALTTTNDNTLVQVLGSSLYPGAQENSIMMVIEYCRAAGLDPLQKPVHIVPMWDRNIGGMRDVIMPGVGLYRTQASRTGQYAGMSEPEFGPDVTEVVGDVEITYPQWCRVTVRRKLPDGTVAEFTAREFWKENYAIKGGKERSIAPNAMWSKRPYGQLAKCAQAQALRIAFPELGAQPTAEEMEGKQLRPEDAQQIIDIGPSIASFLDRVAAAASVDELKRVSKEGAKHFNDKRDVNGYREFAAAVQARGALLRAAEAQAGAQPQE
jgi:phage recombination protein Bet